MSTFKTCFEGIIEFLKLKWQKRPVNCFQSVTGTEDAPPISAEKLVSLFAMLTFAAMASGLIILLEILIFRWVEGKNIIVSWVEGQKFKERMKRVKKRKKGKISLVSARP